jgi:serine O-acetyltransferase
MARERAAIKFALARVWAYPLWISVSRSGAFDTVMEDVDWWMHCINDDQLLGLDRYTQFAYLNAALKEFHTLMHYRLRGAPLPLRLLMRVMYRTDPTLYLEADSIGPGLFIQHGFATGVSVDTIGSHCWINQQVTLGFDHKGRPTLGNNVRVAPGAIVLGKITLHDGATVLANATVIHDVGPGEIVVGPLATPLKRRQQDGGAPA